MQKLEHIAGWLQKRGITLYYVGGCVRDELMGNTPDDIDICVVGGINAGHVQGYLEIMKPEYIDSLTSVHGDFPIWIVEIDGIKYEFAMARSERKTGLTRTEFETMVQDVSIEEDLKRRDFTINAIAKNVLTGEFVDPYHGIDDIKLGLIDPVSEAFKEDTLRVYRGARFAARFGFTPTPTFYSYATTLIPNDVSDERVGKELMKLFTATNIQTSTFFQVLRYSRWLGYHFVELENLVNIPQNPEHHPEGDAYVHTLHCIDAADTMFLRVIMLCHDLGKATHTTISPEGKISSAGHEEAGVELCRKLLKRIHFCDHKTINQMSILVKLHMTRAVINDGNKEKIARRTLRELMHWELSYVDLIDVITCDLKGRPPKVWEGEPYIGQDIMFHLLLFDKMTPIVTGKKLLEYGLKPSTEFKAIIDKALELQDRGTLDETNWVERLRGCGFKQFKKETDDSRTSKTES